MPEVCPVSEPNEYESLCVKLVEALSSVIVTVPPISTLDAESTGVVALGIVSSVTDWLMVVELRLDPLMLPEAEIVMLLLPSVLW